MAAPTATVLGTGKTQSQLLEELLTETRITNAILIEAFNLSGFDPAQYRADADVNRKFTTS
jgi:hypothetical protein